MRWDVFCISLSRNSRLTFRSEEGVQEDRPVFARVTPTALGGGWSFGKRDRPTPSSAATLEGIPFGCGRRPRCGATIHTMQRSRLSRIGVAIDTELLRRFDRHIEGRGYTNRSEAFRDLIRDELVQTSWESKNAEVIGTITIAYDHHVHQLNEKLTEVQHNFHKCILSTLHVHLDHDHCLEVLVVRGKAGQVKRIADTLISIKGVKHGKLTASTTGAGLP